MKRTCLVMCLLLGGCFSEEDWTAVTPSAWAMAVKKCEVNGGVSYLNTAKLKSGGYRVRVVCGNNMRAEFFSSAEAR